MPTHRLFGIEQEHFVLHTDGSPPAHAEIDQLYDALRTDGFRTRTTNRHGQVLAVSRPTEFGELVVTNDSCTHILEVAFPPLRDLSEFRAMYAEVFGLLNERLRPHGLSIQRGAVFDPPPLEIHWRPKETDPEGERLKKFISREPLVHPLFAASFPALFAATHVSLSVPADEAYPRLESYYAYEFLVPLLFSNSRSFQGVAGHCIRPLAWLANFHQPYPLLGIPDPIPTSRQQYEAQRSASPFRDYSFVAVRDAHRLEFRAACSQDTVEEVEQLIRFHLAVDAAVTRGVRPPIDGWTPQTLFQQACLEPTPELIEVARAALETLGEESHALLRRRGTMMSCQPFEET